MKKFMVGLLLAVVVFMGINTGTVSAADRRLKIINNSSQTIYHVRATNSGRSRWGRDLLGNVTLYPNQYIVIDLDDNTGACVFDLRAETADNSVEQYGLNICEATYWRLIDR